MTTKTKRKLICWRNSSCWKMMNSKQWVTKGGGSSKMKIESLEMLLIWWWLKNQSNWLSSHPNPLKTRLSWRSATPRQRKKWSQPSALTKKHSSWYRTPRQMKKAKEAPPQPLRKPNWARIIKMFSDYSFLQWKRNRLMASRYTSKRLLLLRLSRHKRGLLKAMLKWVQVLLKARSPDHQYLCLFHNK